MERNVSPQQLLTLEEFMCRLYGQKVSLVNDGRHNIFRLTCKSTMHCPQMKTALLFMLREQTIRQRYGVAVWDPPLPVGHGWMPDPDDAEALLCNGWEILLSFMFRIALWLHLTVHLTDAAARVLTCLAQTCASALMIAPMVNTRCDVDSDSGETEW